MSSIPHALLLTVGTGDVDQLRETLLEPLKKSIRSRKVQRVILLPSHATRRSAEQLAEELADERVELRPLPRNGDEEDVDACFAWFDRVLGELRSDDLDPENILVDFTRGTKAMSAALVLAAVRHGLPTLRYITSPQRDRRGMVVPGSERPVDFPTGAILAGRTLELAQRFCRAGNFPAALGLLPDPDHELAALWPRQLLDAATALRPALAFYAAWDRLDYESAAAEHIGSADALPAGAAAGWRPLWPTLQQREWVANLAHELPASHEERANHLRRVAADLLANGERRLRDGQLEDALLRAYRVVELVGQVRLFDHGIDSAEAPPSHPAVADLLRQLEKDDKNSRPGRSRAGNLQLGREHVARLLKRLKDPMAEKLLNLRTDGLGAITKRNHSVLIHGFVAVGSAARRELPGLFRQLARLLHDDGGPEADSRLSIARTLALTPP